MSLEEKVCGIRQLTKSLAVDRAQYHINVNAIEPGYIKTDLTQPLWQDEMFDNWIKKRTPEGRFGKFRITSAGFKNGILRVRYKLEKI